MRFRLLGVVFLLFFRVALAADTSSDTTTFRDAKDCINQIEKISKLKIDDQIDAWQTFLSDHPQNTFRKEIEKNIELLGSLSQKKSFAKKGDERDADLYLKAIEFSKKLNREDQILLWQQFLDENPTSIYRNDVEIRLYKLKRSKPRTSTMIVPQQPAPAILPAPKPTSQLETSSPAKPIIQKKPIKDPDQALFLASLAGIVVPGMGHWYTSDFVIAGVLTVIRVAGIGIAIPGIINSEYEKIYIGGGLYFLSYAIDIADAPFSAQRYNDSHTQAFLDLEKTRGHTIPLFAYNFKF